MSRLALYLVFAFCLALPARANGAEGKTFKVLVINLDPVIESEGGKRLHEVMKWNDPRKLAKTYCDDLNACSHHWATYKVVDWIDADLHPLKTDGFQYTDETYLACAGKNAPWHKPDSVDYRRLIKDFKLAERVKSGEIDEVFFFGPPYSGFYESQMAGPGAYWCNSPGLPDVDSGRIFIIMGFNYQRGVGEMLEDYGHRSESIMTHIYGSWNAYPPKHNWDLFTLVDKNIVDHDLYTAGCGNVHYAPNTKADYQWGDTTPVWSTCDDWLNNWPDLKGTKKKVDCTEWGGGEIRAHHIWWLKHFPHAAGVNPDGKQNNWWKYLADFNSYPESR